MSLAKLSCSFVLCGLLLACTATPPVSSAAAPAACRADRGIGGTGAPFTQAERGIGGTGAPFEQAERGIGGTGITGVITGFGSVCLDGLEVGLKDPVPVTVDGFTSHSDLLETGQVVSIQADGPPSSLSARWVAIRHAVVGPVEASDGDTLLVARQKIALSRRPTGDASPSIGVWVAVSGLRRPDGTIEATRLDRQTPGQALIRGTLVRDGQRLRIGNAQIELPAGTKQPHGEIVVRGSYRNGVLAADSVEEDAAAGDPTTFFGPDVSRFVVESYVTASPGSLALLNGLALQDYDIADVRSGYAVVSFERAPTGALRVTDIAQAPTPGLQPAPVPDREGAVPSRFGPQRGSTGQNRHAGPEGSNASPSGGGFDGPPNAPGGGPAGRPTNQGPGR